MNGEGYCAPGPSSARRADGDRRRRALEPGPLRAACRAQRRACGRTALHGERNQRRAPLRRRQPQPYVKDAFHRAVVEGDAAAVNPAGVGTKAAWHYRLTCRQAVSGSCGCGSERAAEPVEARLAPSSTAMFADG